MTNMTESEKECKIPWWFRRKAVKLAAYSAVILMAFVVVSAVFVDGAADSLQKIAPIILAYLAASKGLLAWYMHSKKDKDA